MKKLFFYASVFMATTAAAQQKDIFDIQEHLKHRTTKKAKLPMPVFAAPAPSPETFMKLSNGDMVYYGNGQMPCIKPDMSQQYAMPNVSQPTFYSYNKLQYQLGEIPNGAKPSYLLSDK
jgi:hypothetical protein